MMEGKLKGPSLHLLKFKIGGRRGGIGKKKNQSNPKKDI